MSIVVLKLPNVKRKTEERPRKCRSCEGGNTSADQTERLRAFAVLLWILGLSHRASSLILSGLKAMVSFMTIWRDVQAAAQKVKRRNQWERVRVLGLDGAYVLGCGLWKKFGNSLMSCIPKAVRACMRSGNN